jgi:hypothetical protein
MIDNLITYNITSKNRLEGSTNNFIIKLNIPVDIINSITNVSITDISIPKSFYQIENGFNTFNLYENNVLINIILPAGNYSKLQLFSYLNIHMTNQSLNSVIYTITDEHLSYDTGKIKITADKPLITKKLLFSKNDVFQFLGFNTDIQYSFIDQIVSPNIINLNSEDVLLLHSNICSNNNNDLLGGSDVLSSIYTSGQKNYSYITKSFDLIYNMKPFTNNNYFKFYLTNENNNIIDLGGIDLNFVLNLFTYTPNNKIYNKINNLINYSLINN